MRSPPEADRAVGLEEYASASEPCYARMRSEPEDFRVEELAALEGVEAEWRPGLLPLYRVEKRLIDTFHVEKEVSRALRGRVSLGGLKDKRAVAVQYFTPVSTRSQRPLSIRGSRFTAGLMGYLPRPLTRGSVHGNRFVITLRDCCPRILEAAGETMDLARRRKLPNYFGLQRFGSAGGTHKVGKALVRRDFEGAVRAILCEPRPGEGERQRMAREAMESGSYERGIGLLGPGQDVEAAVAASLARRRGDWVGALRAVGLRLRRFYVHAFQSYLFNRTLSLAVREGEDISEYEPGDNWCELSSDGLAPGRVMGVKDPVGKAPVPMLQIPGFAYRNYGSRFDGYSDRVMLEEGVSPKDFYVAEMQEVSAEGGFRRPHLGVEEWRVDGRPEAVTLTFNLARGGYATVLLREVVKYQDPVAAGFV